MPIEDLESKLSEYPWCYLVTSGEERSHLVAVRPTVVQGGLRVATGHSSRANVVRNPKVVLTFPPSDAGGYTLLVDGDAHVDGDGVVVVPTWAVLHRPAV